METEQNTENQSIKKNTERDKKTFLPEKVSINLPQTSVAMILLIGLFVCASIEAWNNGFVYPKWFSEPAYYAFLGLVGLYFGKDGLIPLLRELRGETTPIEVKVNLDKNQLINHATRSKNTSESGGFQTESQADSPKIEHSA